VLRSLREIDARSTQARDLAQRVGSALEAKFRLPPQRATGPARPVPSQASASGAAEEKKVATGRASEPIVPIEAADTSVLASDEVAEFGAILPGQVLGSRYRVNRKLGRGGFGAVFLVEDQMVKDEIALKLIHPELVKDESARARFIHEVRYARKITHPNVIRIHDFVSLGQIHAISMEYFASHTLARSILRGLHEDQALGLKFARAIGRGMDVAHQVGIVHRDLKPANILVNDQDMLKIVDFGLAAAASHGDSRLTKTGHMVGTATYMSPEHARGGSIDLRADIYSFGVILYEMFTGTVPYSGEHAVAVIFQHLEGRKEPPRSRNPAIGPRLEAIILKAMALDPVDRYQSFKDLLADLDSLKEVEAA